MVTNGKTDEQPLVLENEAQQKLPAVRKPRAAAVVPAQPTTPMDLLRIVTERGASPEEISKFMDLVERQEAKEARQLFVQAMAAFKKNPPTIKKTNVADFTTAKGRTTYTYADLATVCEAVIAALAEHGISHDWSVEQPGEGPDANMILVTCTLTHEKGHSKSTTLKAPADPSGSKNAIQAIGSTVSYLERYSLLAACGIAVKEQGDDDGQSTGAPKEGLQPTKHEIDEPTLHRALVAIQQKKYSWDEMIGFYELTPDQLAKARKVLDMKGEAEK